MLSVCYTQCRLFNHCHKHLHSLFRTHQPLFCTISRLFQRCTSWGGRKFLLFCFFRGVWKVCRSWWSRLLPTSQPLPPSCSPIICSPKSKNSYRSQCPPATSQSVGLLFISARSAPSFSSAYTTPGRTNNFCRTCSHASGCLETISFFVRKYQLRCSSEN